jgi:transcriptional regulator with XRE-family HTH domain
MIQYTRQGNILKEAREARGLTIEEIAELAGYSERMWRMIEKGDRSLAQDKIGKVAKHLRLEEMTLKEFFDREKAK